LKRGSLPSEVKKHIHLEVEAEWSGSANLQKRWLSLTAFVGGVVLPYRCNSKKNGGGIFDEKTSCVTVV
jgi:hypothetical protein